jgi:hypothetical protein
MSNETSIYRYGEIEFNAGKTYGNYQIEYTIIPYGYLCREIKNPEKLFLFRHMQEMKDYFTNLQ